MFSCNETIYKVEQTMQKDRIYLTNQYRTFYTKIKCDLLNFSGV